MHLPINLSSLVDEDDVGVTAAFIRMVPLPWAS
jgi:hypothetical protein